MRWTAAMATALLAMVPLTAAAQDRPDQRAFFAIFKELVETDTTQSAGSCTKAAEQISVRLKAGGFRDADITLFSVPEHPKDGGIVAVLPGRDVSLKPMLLLGHLDVVEAKRADWTRDPFVLVEEGGYYYARGTSDMKGMAAIWVDSLIRMRAGPAPKRTVKLALTCGEETTTAWNGAQYLSTRRADLIAAGFALNEGGGGKLTAEGKRQSLAIQVGEKAAQNYTLVATNRGGHSSRPTPDNAIYELADAIRAVQGYTFPASFTDTTRAYFTATAKTSTPEVAAAIGKLIADPTDAAADAIVSRDDTFRSTLRTSCVATLVNAGHAENALPQRATANVNCRIFPGETTEGTLAVLQRLAGPKVTVTANQPVRPIAVVPPLDPAIIEPITKLAAKHFPGVPVVPSMSTGATDAVYLKAAGIPVYGVPGIFNDPATSGIHGLNERVPVRSLYDGRDYLFDLVKALAG